MTEPFPDPGLATERTQLAWQRYTLGVAVIAVLSMRAGIRGHHEALGFLLGFGLAGSAATLQLAGPRLAPQTAIRVVVATSIAAAAGALLLGLLL